MGSIFFSAAYWQATQNCLAKNHFNGRRVVAINVDGIFIAQGQKKRRNKRSTKRNQSRPTFLQLGCNSFEHFALFKPVARKQIENKWTNVAKMAKFRRREPRTAFWAILRLIFVCGQRGKS